MEDSTRNRGERKPHDELAARRQRRPGSMPMEWPGDHESEIRNLNTHNWDHHGGECETCGMRWHWTGAKWPCGVEPLRTSAYDTGMRCTFDEALTDTEARRDGGEST